MGSMIIVLVAFGFAALVIYFAWLALKIVPQSENWIVERLGRFHKSLAPGVNGIIPFFDSVRFRVSVLERQLPPKPINAITLDNVTITLALAVFYRIVDAPRTMYRITNVDDAIFSIVNGTVRSVIGKSDFDSVQSNRRHLSDEIQKELGPVAEEWGIALTRVEILEVDVDPTTKSAMQMQLNAERSRRAKVTEAEGQKEATQLEADAKLYSAQREAEAKIITADAEAYAVQAVSKAIENGGNSAVEFEIKKLQAQAVQELGRGNSGKIVLLPTDVVSTLSNTLSRFISKA